MLQEKVLETYNRKKTINGTAVDLGISACTVQKILVAEGVIDTPLTRRIAELRKIGLSQKEIAKVLNLSVSCVSKNTPYQRGSYLNANKSVNAVKIAKWREKKKKQQSSSNNSANK